MPNHTEPSLYFTLTPNETCLISQKKPIIQTRKVCKQHKICISLRRKTFFSNISPMNFNTLKKSTSSLMQLLLTYTQFGYL